MSAHEWFVEHRTSFVVRSLEAEEESTFRAHLEGCGDCREAIHQIEQELAWLPLGTTPVTPRPELKRRLVESALGIRPRRSFAPLLALAASLVLAVGAWAWATSRVRSAERATEVARANLSHQLEMARDTLEIMRTADRVRHASIRMGEQQGGMVIFADRPYPHVECRDLRPAGAGARKDVPVLVHYGDRNGAGSRGEDRGRDSRVPDAADASERRPRDGSCADAGADRISSAAPEGKELAHLML